MIELHSPASVQPDPVNPRRTDPARLELIKLSLRKFGFVLPLYVRTDGHLISGHQRTAAAEALGWAVPVVRLTKKLRDVAGLNLTFNRATNDFRLTDVAHGETVGADVVRLLRQLPDTLDRYPCLRAEPASVPALIAANKGGFNRYAANAARGLATYGIDMPIVVGPGGVVINGMGRLQYASERSRATIDAVHILDPEQADLMAIVMNGLSMDFDLNPAFRDHLRANAFRRARQSRTALGSGYLFPLGVRRCRDFVIGQSKEGLKQVFGSQILDFGAGHGDEARMLRKAGLKVLAFEPYRVSGGRPRRANGRRSALQLLKAVKGGFKFSSIVLSSVLNSVPFDADRRHIVAIVAALADADTTVFAAARSTIDPNWNESRTALGLGATAARSARFVLNDEPGMVISELNDAPKVQRYFQPREIEELFAPHFEELTLGRHINNVTVIARRPKPIDAGRLRAALQFEFDLPYAEGRMGLAAEAIAAFSERLGLSI